MDIHFRELNANDLELAHELLDCFGQAFEDEVSYEQQRPDAAYLQALLGNDGIIALVALVSNHVIGGLVAYELRKLEQHRSEFYIYDLAVTSPYRRQGVATGLIKALKPIARERGAWVIYVQADQNDEPAVTLYTQLGVREDVLHFDIPVVDP
ncbi:MAG: AAC(3)-I family aminoglycoside N-acetyltransferase [Granulosicoccus sp.]|nr:AAC(3)-I family aminoglycoside N-acetyltransferase [Granulosicoccus sp.]